MKYTLMHKRIPVAELEIDEEVGYIKSVGKVFAPQHLPVGVSFRNGIADRGGLYEWWSERAIPQTRLDNGERDVNVRRLLAKSLCLSLSDQYWVRPTDERIAWDRVNFFVNAFSGDYGDFLFGCTEREEGLDLNSPDLTTDGSLKKRWQIIDGKRCLIKGGSRPSCQQPFNEAIATEIMKRLGIPHVPYDLVWNGDEPYCVCEDFVTAETELVSARRIIQTKKKSDDVSIYQHFIDCCRELGAPDVVPALDQMIVLDYLIANEDRHLNNFGLLRNAETLEWIGLAPIYDSGNSLGYEKTASDIRTDQKIACKPFKNRHDEQIKLVSDFGWLDFGKLSDIRAVIGETFADERAKERVGTERIAAITDAVQMRIERLGGIAQTHGCEENIAENNTLKFL